MNIEIGKIYKNKWGDKRIPMKESGGDVWYASMDSAGVGYVFNPYRNVVKKENFKTWELTDGYAMDTEMFDEVISRATARWGELILETMHSLSDMMVVDNSIE